MQQGRPPFVAFGPTMECLLTDSQVSGCIGHVHDSAIKHWVVENIGHLVIVAERYDRAVSTPSPRRGNLGAAGHPPLGCCL